MRLTILIPVYNGGTHLDSLLSTFSDCENSRLMANAEILVVNNGSTDDTLQVARSYDGRIANLRIIDSQTHVPSAEQNIFRSFIECRGEYVWTLGCNDLPIFDSFDQLLSLIESGCYDFMVFNNHIVNADGTFVTTSQIKMGDLIYEAPIDKIAERVGVWFTMAGISGHIIRRSAVERYNLEALIRETSVIYSHVIAYIECFHGRRAALIDLPIVRYFVNYRDMAHWQKVARLFGVCDEYFWTVGFLRQIAYLEARGLVDDGFLMRIVERNGYFEFSPLDILLGKTYAQIRSGMDFTKPDFDFLCAFLLARAPIARPVVFALREAYYARFRLAPLLRARKALHAMLKSHGTHSEAPSLLKRSRIVSLFWFAKGLIRSAFRT